MRQKLYISGISVLLIIFSGLIFKMNHWPAAGILLTIGISLLVLVFIPVALYNHYKAEGNRTNLLLYFVTWLTCFVAFGAMLFKIQHWPYAGIALTVAIPFPYVVFLPVFLAVTSRNKNFNIYNTVFVLLLLALNSVFTTLLSLNVSRDRIYDSYNLSLDFNKNSAVLSQLPENSSRSRTAIMIDQVVKTVDSYRTLIFNQAGISAGQWENEPMTLLNPDARQVAAEAIFNRDSSPGNKLEMELQDLVSEMGKDPYYSGFAKTAPELFDIGPGNDESSWSARNFTGTTLSWSLIYLDGLKSDLLLLKQAGR